jgi:hypothetical protein
MELCRTRTQRTTRGPYHVSTPSREVSHHLVRRRSPPVAAARSAPVRHSRSIPAPASGDRCRGRQTISSSRGIGGSVPKRIWIRGFMRRDLFAAPFLRLFQMAWKRPRGGDSEWSCGCRLDALGLRRQRRRPLVRESTAAREETSAGQRTAERPGGFHDGSARAARGLLSTVASHEARSVVDAGSLADIRRGFHVHRRAMHGSSFLPALGSPGQRTNGSSASDEGPEGAACHAARSNRRQNSRTSANRRVGTDLAISLRNRSTPEALHKGRFEAGRVADVGQTQISRVAAIGCDSSIHRARSGKGEPDIASFELGIDAPQIRLTVRRRAGDGLCLVPRPCADEAARTFLGRTFRGHGRERHRRRRHRGHAPRRPATHVPPQIPATYRKVMMPRSFAAAIPRAGVERCTPPAGGSSCPHVLPGTGRLGAPRRKGCRLARRSRRGAFLKRAVPFNRYFPAKARLAPSGNSYEIRESLF